MDTRLLAFHLSTVALALTSFLGGLLAQPALQSALLGPLNLLVPLSPFWGSLGPRLEMACAFAVPAVFVWVGAHVGRWRSGRLPGGLSLLLLFGLPALGLAVGLVGRALLLRVVLSEVLLGSSPGLSLRLFPLALSTSELALGSWGLRLAVIGGMAGVAWVSLRRVVKR